jgi:F0F1-type ATP synthase membrane subunit b/b'
MIGKMTLSSAALLLLATAAFAAPPVEDVSGKRHPNLAAAQRLSRDAWEKITAAQRANEWDLDGHAAKAKELLDKVNEELKMAAEAANKNHR